MTRSLATLCLLCACGAAVRVPPRAADVATVDGIMRAFYEVVNVAPEAPRQWARDATLYAPWIRFVSIGRGRDVWTHAQLVAETEPLVRAGFRERELARTTRRYGNLVHVDSTYETLVGRHAPFTRSRGVNSLELYHDGTRWWIASVMWQSETAEHPIPAALLPTDASAPR